MIEMIPGYTNSMMAEYCSTLLSVITKSQTKTEGKGKEKKEVQVLKYRDSLNKIKELTESCEYYKSIRNAIQLRPYQREIAIKGIEILNRHRFLYLAMEVRTGKTLTSLSIAEKINVKNILFITKKKAIDSIQKDFNSLNPSYKMTIINYESLHTIDDSYDLIICDEAHSLGAFAKPSNRAISVRDLIRKNKPYVILLSGTPTPESYSQMYHQVYGIPNNPFKEFSSFYRFCDRYVNIKEKRINGMAMRDYSNGSEGILEAMKPYTISYTQKDAGFVVETTEHILEVAMKPSTYSMIAKLKKDLVLEGVVEVVLADTSVKLMSKVHQMFSGTVKFESGSSMTIDTSKADYIKEHFNGKKIGIFYKFKEELEALKAAFGDQLTTELNVFEDTDKNIALQIVSGREGISLKDADCLVYYNIDFSATSYWQSRDRMTTKDRLKNNIYWIFAKSGIEHDIYKAVIKKKDYTVSHFKKSL